MQGRARRGAVGAESLDGGPGTKESPGGKRSSAEKAEDEDARPRLRVPPAPHKDEVPPVDGPSPLGPAVRATPNPQRTMPSKPRPLTLTAWSLFLSAVWAGSRVEAQIIVRGEEPIRDVVLRGHVLTETRRAGVPEAFVAQVDHGVGAFTDRDGRFELTLPTGAPPVLLVGKDGYETVSFEPPDSLLDRPLLLTLPAASDSRPPSPSLENVFGRMERAPRDGERLVARLRAEGIQDEERTAVDVILAHTDDSVERCSNGSICSSVYGGVRGIVRAREILLCVDGRWFERRGNVVGNLLGGAPSDAGATQIRLLERIPAEEIYRAEIIRLARRAAGPVPYRVHIYTRDFMAVNLARNAVQLPPFRC